MSGRNAEPVLALLPRCAVTAGLVFIVACGTHDDRAPKVSKALPVSHDSARAATVAESTAVARDQWNVAEVVRRLGEAGLVVTDRGKTVRHPGLRVPGEVLDVSGSELQTYVYDNATARARDSAALDTATRAAAIGVPQRPHFIINNNLIALHFTTNDRLAEQVHDALMARHRGQK